MRIDTDREWAFDKTKKTENVYRTATNEKVGPGSYEMALN
jgi:hypothetical protein